MKNCGGGGGGERTPKAKFLYDKSSLALLEQTKERLNKANSINRECLRNI